MTDWGRLQRRAETRTFTARYSGECEGCGEAIEPGDQAGYVDDELVGECCLDA